MVRPRAAPRSSAQHVPTLFSEVAAGHVDVVKRVLAANPAAAALRDGATGATALHAAAAAGHLDVVRALLTARTPAAIDAQDDEGNTALHLAAAADRADIVAELVSGPRKDAARVRNARGATPLHAAAAAAAFDAARELLAAGARRSVADREGRTPADCVPCRGTRNAVLFAMLLAPKPGSLPATTIPIRACASGAVSPAAPTESGTPRAVPLSARTAASVNTGPFAHKVVDDIGDDGGCRPPSSAAAAASAAAAEADSRLVGLEGKVARLLAARYAADAADAEARDAAAAAAEARLAATEQRVEGVGAAVAALAAKVTTFVDATDADRVATKAALDAARADAVAATATARAVGDAAGERAAAVEAKVDDLAASVREALAVAKSASRRRAAEPAGGETSGGEGATSDAGGKPSRRSRWLSRGAAAAAVTDLDAVAPLVSRIDGLEERVARGEGWDAAAQNFARGVGGELTRLRAETGAITETVTAVDSRLVAAEAGLRMLHGYVSHASAAFSPEAVKKLATREARVREVHAALQTETRARKAAVKEIERVKAACRDLQARLDAVEGGKWGARAPAPATHKRTSWLAACFGRDAAAAARRRLSTDPDDALALTVVPPASPGMGDRTVVVEEEE